MMQGERSEVLARRLVDLYNAGTADWVEACHDPATTWHLLTFANDRVVEQIDYPILCSPEPPGQDLS